MKKRNPYRKLTRPRRRIDYSLLPLAKGPTRQQLKARRDRRAAAVVKAVRPVVADRDGPCRLGAPRIVRVVEVAAGSAFTVGQVWLADVAFGPCRGASAWAHLRGRRRSQTRGEAPEARHTTTDTAMLCEGHHDLEERGLLRRTALTPAGADGPLQWTYRRTVFEEVR